MKKQVKKLPAVWVTITERSTGERFATGLSSVKQTGGGKGWSYHRYVPAKPARKVCRWYLDRGATEAQNFYDAECGYQRGDLDPDFKFCPNCGKRVREVGK